MLGSGVKQMGHLVACWQPTGDCCVPGCVCVCVCGLNGLGEVVGGDHLSCGPALYYHRLMLCLHLVESGDLTGCVDRLLQQPLN